MKNNIERMPESNELGQNVQLVVKFIRHGERDLAGNLQDYGREVTRQQARERVEEFSDYHAIKAIGSNAGPSSFVEDADMQMQRSLETAHIYAKEIAGNMKYKTKGLGILSYETIKSPAPYNHTAIYNSFIPKDFAILSPKEKAAVSKYANQKTTDHLISLITPEAEVYKKEVAGAFAVVIEHYVKMAKRLYSGSKVLILAGAHGATMELLLQKALVRDVDGKKVIGFKSLDEIGGDFDPSEAFNVKITTDENNQVTVRLSFDHAKRPRADMTLDSSTLNTLAAFYKQMHPSIGLV